MLIHLLLKESFKKNVWENKINENWRKRYNEEFMQLFGNLDVLSFVRVCRLNWIGHVNRMDSKSEVNQVFKIILREVD